jgi:hypothetical protein
MTDIATRQVRETSNTHLRTATALAAVGFSVLYLVSDLLELAQGGFSGPQLVLTYLAEAAIPLFVLGLYAAQRPQIGTLGLLGGVGYAYAYVFFTGTVLLALVNRPADWNALVGELGPWVTIHGLVMVVAGSAFGVAVIRAGVLPPWTGVTLIAGVVLVALSSLLPDLAVVATACAGVRDLGFAGMGVALLAEPRSLRRLARERAPHTEMS